MLPAGKITEETVADARRRCWKRGDTIIDGGNTFYQDDIRRAASARRRRASHYVDVGTSGGVWGLERGYCMMIGGEKEAVDRLDPIFAALAPGAGDIDAHAGPREAAIRAPSKAICIAARRAPAISSRWSITASNTASCRPMPKASTSCRQGKLDETCRRTSASRSICADIAEVWRRGSVVSSWLLDLTAMALADDPTLENSPAMSSDSGEGRWTINAAIEEAVPANVLSAALYARFRSREEHSFGEKLLSAMRHQLRRPCRAAGADRRPRRNDRRAARATADRRRRRLRDGDLRRERRPHQAPARPGALQSAPRPVCCRDDFALIGVDHDDRERRRIGASASRCFARARRRNAAASRGDRSTSGWERLAATMTYLSGDFDDDATYARAAATLAAIDASTLRRQRAVLSRGRRPLLRPHRGAARQGRADARAGRRLAAA